MSDFIEPRNNSDIEKSGLDINSVPFVEVDQPGPASLGKQAKGFWVTFSTMFKKNQTVQYPVRSALVANSVHGHVQPMRFLLKAEITPLEINSHQESATERFIRLIIFAVSSAAFVLKHVQLVRLL